MLPNYKLLTQITYSRHILFKKPLVNNQIRAFEVRVIDETGKQLGIVSSGEALRMARERGLDLIQVTEKVFPPVCKIFDYGKYLYQEEKKERKIKKQKGGRVKGIRLGFNISSHDLEVKARQAEKFLREGNKVKIELLLRGRQRALQSFAREKIKKFLEILAQTISYNIEGNIRKEFGKLIIIISKK